MFRFLVLFVFVSLSFAQDFVCQSAPSFIRSSGRESSPLDVVIFVSSACPKCKETAVMFYEMSNTVYSGKIKVSIKPLYKQLGDIALVAANSQNKSWELVRAYSHTSNRITADNINELFDEAKINKDKIYEDMRDTALIFSVLQNNYEEAKKCQMNFTPHILFNGIIYDGEINAQSIMQYIDKILAKSR
jgi:protein-disulfide isomerase